ncbi:uncharacterized protein L203_104607 [Cryptococcus depauperatus CBS 7841]|uniref:Uncharacterized protein n=1 Tax=Cryptococcus depauperatus CBS 7841 TaxID=1295531 RepID=A0A1E3ILJ9_9TREE|nr:hypothetical protein L203_02189 [Cryptococcus depauperatus CBS 7841]
MSISWCPQPSPGLQSQQTYTPSYPSSFGTSSEIDTGSESGDSDSELDALIQEEWEESLRQMEMVISIIVIPYFGKYIGRHWAFRAYERWRTVGLGRAFFGLL